MPAAIAGLLILGATGASAQVAQVQLAYDTYAAGIEVMQMHALLRPRAVELPHRRRLPYHRTRGAVVPRPPDQHRPRHWHDDQAAPLEFFGEGVWRGQERRTLIDYDHGLPQIKELQPPQESEREPVPPELQLHTMDTLSALAQLMRRVAA